MSNLQNSPTISIPDFIIGEVSDMSALLSQMDQVYNDTAISRYKVQQKLDKAIDQVDLNLAGDPEQLEAQMSVLDKLDKLAGSREKAFTTRITTRLKIKETEANNKLLGAMSAKILKEFTPSGDTAYVPSASEELSMSGIEAAEQKLAQMERINYNDGELKYDPSDIS